MRNIITILALTLLLSCSSPERDNPFDPNSKLWDHPHVQIDDYTVNINDSIQLFADVENKGIITRYIWNLDDTTIETNDNYLYYSFGEKGRYLITVVTHTENGRVSLPDSGYITVTNGLPILNAVRDTIVNSDSLAIGFSAIDTNVNGEIVLYWGTVQGASDTIFSSRDTTIVFMNEGVDFYSVIWGVKDDDENEESDTFTVRFNTAPDITFDSTAINSITQWTDYNNSSEKGTLSIPFNVTDINTFDSISIRTVITNTTTDQSETLDGSALITNLDPNSDYDLTIVASDLYGGESSSSIQFQTPRSTNQKRIDAAGKLFQMGDTSLGYDPVVDVPIHNVELKYDIWVDSVEVTQSLFDSIMNVYPTYIVPEWKTAYGVDPQKPAYSVSWADAILFCNARSNAEGVDSVYLYTIESGAPGNGLILSDVRRIDSSNGYRLPTEAEWEFACRGNETSTYYWGGDTSSAIVKQYSWFYGNAQNPIWSEPHAIESGTQFVGTLLPNGFGLYDMSGNVAEWCFDFFEEEYYKSSPLLDPRGPENGTARVTRGGSWTSIPFLSLRSGARESSTSARYNIGFRTVRSHLP